MTPERWRQITDVFESALRRGAAERAAFLAERCAGDEPLRREVEAMLASHEGAPDFMKEPAAAVAALTGGDGPSLRAGQSVAHYRVLAPIGSGGMGDVYLAHDTVLGRRVALKLLPAHLAGDAQRARLFEREARAASALNHPHIVTVYEIGRWDARHYIAMEYVEGETLGAHIRRKGAPLAKLLKYLQQVAEGLAKAHAAGIVHRDLKPDNIMVTADGYAKVLDFGLAKLVERPERAGSAGDAGEAATALMEPPSMPGMVMGTAGYMSPEQAQGRVGEIDHRSDIFSFGCILYEAATGAKAFAGADVLDSLHKIVHAPTPEIRQVSPQAPAELDKIVRRCLAKDPEKRYQSIKDVAIELEELRQELRDRPASSRQTSTENREAAAVVPTSAATASGAPAGVSTAEIAGQPTEGAGYFVGGINRHKAVTLVVATVILIALAGAGLLLSNRGYFGRRQAAGDAPFSFERMKLTRLTTTGRTTDAAISPDGKYVAYLNVERLGGGAREGNQTASLWLRQVATGRNIRIVEPGSFINRGLTFSPDSNYLYYRVSSARGPTQLLRIPVLGGDAQKVVDDIFSGVGFSPDGKRMAFVRNHKPVVGESYLIVANADGTDERIVATSRGGELFAIPSRPTSPAWSPDGKSLACALGTYNGNISLLRVEADGGGQGQIGPKRWGWIDRVAWLPGGLLMTARDETSPQMQIWHVAYPSGESRRVTNDLNEYQGMSLSADAGSAVVVHIERETDIWVAPADKPRDASAVTSGAGTADGYWGISWTPDGKIVYGSNASGNRDIWLLDFALGTQKQLTADARQNFYPVVTPDGRQIIFSSDRGPAFGLWRMDIDGGNPAQLMAGPGLGQVTCSPDGQWVFYSSTGSQGVPALWKVPIAGGDPVLLNDEYWEELPAVSPDGRQIALQYFKLGTAGISVGLISPDGGPLAKVAEPPFRLGPTMRWTPDGRALAYIDNRGEAGQIWALPVGGGTPRQLTDFKSDYVFWFDFSRDGKQLAVARGRQTSDVVLIQNLK